MGRYKRCSFGQIKKFYNAHESLGTEVWDDKINRESFLRFSGVIFDYDVCAAFDLLDVLRELPHSDFYIEPKYAGRPDILALEMLGDAELAWVILNSNNFEDISELVAGETIRLMDRVALNFWLNSQYFETKREELRCL